MDYKDTVVRETPQIPMSFARLLSDFRVDKTFFDVVARERQVQAEISFKVGAKEAYNLCYEYAHMEFDKEKYPEFVTRLRGLGIK